MKTRAKKSDEITAWRARRRNGQVSLAMVLPHGVTPPFNARPWRVYTTFNHFLKDYAGAYDENDKWRAERMSPGTVAFLKRRMTEGQLFFSA